MSKSTSSTDKIILGVDPGTVVTGYGIIKMVGSKPIPLDFGAIRPPKTASSSEKYLIIFEAIETLLERFVPDAVAVESQYVHKNAMSAMKLGMARAMAILASARRKIPIYEYAPTKAKLAVVGKGSASKEQVQKMIQLLLQLPTPPHPHDAADALALALCHAHQLKIQEIYA